MPKASGKQVALLLLSVLITFAAAEIIGTAEEKKNSVPCSADGCGDCWCCLPSGVVSLGARQVVKDDGYPQDTPAATLLSLPTFLPLQIHKLGIAAYLPNFSLVLSFVLSPRAPPIFG